MAPASSPGPERQPDLADRRVYTALDPPEGRGDRLAGRLLSAAHRAARRQGGALHLSARVAGQKTRVDHRLPSGPAGTRW